MLAYKSACVIQMYTLKTEAIFSTDKVEKELIWLFNPDTWDGMYQ